ncbi:MAG: DUF305 domain-containing protein [Gemmatimonadaceae bacterium]
MRSLSQQPTPIVLLTIVITACSTATGGRVTPTPSPAPTVQTNPAGVAQARQDSLRHPYTEADVQFMYNMIGHHAQAVVMANSAPTHGASPSVLVLAQRIINAQQDEIGTMQRWLRDRLKPVADASGTSMMMMNGVAHEMLMPGMLTDAQMKQLDAAKGKEFDRLFLTFMLQHHGGAVTMVKELFDTYGAAQDEIVFKFASDVNVDQQTEIARMQRMLAALTMGGQSP